MLIAFTPVFMVAPAVVFAADISGDLCQTTPGTGQLPEVCEDINAASGGSANANPLYGPKGVLTRAIDVMSIVTAIIATIVLVIAGTRMTLSQGDTNKIASVRSTIIYAVVGLIVAAVAQLVVRLIISKL